MRHAALWALLLSVSGCLPYGCNREESRAISAADSLSRAFAETVPVDTLEPTDMLAGPFEHPRTLAFGPDGTLYATDTGSHRLVIVDPGGDEWTVALDSLPYPYLAGMAGRLPIVYSPEAHRIAAVTGQGIAWSLDVPDDGPGRGVLRYATVDDDGRIWLKLLAEDWPGFIGRVDSTGAFDRRIPLPGPYWRYAGLLRTWAGRPASLSGYLPMVHRVTDGGLDSTALFGFDSPMLARSRQYVAGGVDAPPLLTAAATAVDSMLYVLNMRPGWLRVDAFGPDGRLRAVYVEPDPEFDQDFYPTDLAVRADPAGGFELAVAVVEPEPAVLRYRWPAR